MICKICNSESIELFSTKVLNKNLVKYYQCNKCRFIQTENPYWLEEAYSNVIATQDIGLLYRNIYYTPIVSTLIKLFYNKNLKFLDYGGGYGIFVRLMRDKGFDFYHYDTYCNNIFAEGFEIDVKSKYELVTSFEVFEHLIDPISEIKNMLELGDSIFFSTELQPEILRNEKDWWYVMPETGQHISLYSMETLKYLAHKFDLHLYSNRSTFHLLTKRKISPFLFYLVKSRNLGLIVNKFIKYPKSLLMPDYYELIHKKT